MLKASKSARNRGSVLHSVSSALAKCLHSRNVRKATKLQSSLFLLAHSYHDSSVEYGCYSPPVTKIQKYSDHELKNRQTNANLLQLVSAYRRFGHLSSNLDPLGIQKQELLDELSAGMYGLTEDSGIHDISGIVSPSEVLKNQSDLSTIIDVLQKLYCRNISYEFEHISSLATRQWFAHYVETLDTRDAPSRYKRFHELLTKIEMFEQFLQKKLPNVKRYGLEGSETICVLLDQIIYEGAQRGITDFVTGLSHRGRMSLLGVLFGYPKDELFRKLRGGSEFSNESPLTGDMLVDLAKPGSVHYPDLNISVNVDVLWNACHLESGTPVGMGKSRTKDINIARARKNANHTIGDHVIAISLHGDSSFAGQGVVAESLAMSGLSHFTNGGTIHIIINNQVGFTTPASHTRATRYASDMAKFADIPIIHVNGDYPEEMLRAARIAVAYRQRFRKDIVIDVWSFRTRGHNEMDEPAFTQPAMYQAIQSRKTIPDRFEDKLLTEGYLTKEKAAAIKNSWKDTMSAAFASSTTCNPTDPPKGKRWKLLTSPINYLVEKPTGVSKDILQEVGIRSVMMGEGIKVHPRIQRFHINPRLKRLQKEGEDGGGERNIDWATAEALAFGSLLREGYNVRLCGQDVGRGTFSQRHAMVVCQETERVYVPLNHLNPEQQQQQQQQQGKLEVVNSNLCEEAVVGFEYGVSVEDPFTLAIWEAQFGDFFNNSQTYFDGYIASGETKWGQQNGLVLLLPHGFDGGGPDHSSCRLERHLMLSNDQVDSNEKMIPNIYITNPTTPAQFFHLLRRQVKRNFRKPLIVAGPKTILRLPSATSSLAEMGPDTKFNPVLDDNTAQDPRSVKRVMLVSGKLFYDLAKVKSEHPLGEHVAIVRIEELSPFPKEELFTVLSRYVNARDYVWVQEEPRNAGVYAFVAPRIARILPRHAELRYVGRCEHAATCSGIETQQAAEQEELIGCAFEGMHELAADLVIDNIHSRHHQGRTAPASSTVQQASSQRQTAATSSVISAAAAAAAAASSGHQQWATSRPPPMYAAAQSSDR